MNPLMIISVFEMVGPRLQAYLRVGGSKGLVVANEMFAQGKVPMFTVDAAATDVNVMAEMDHDQVPTTCDFPDCNHLYLDLEAMYVTRTKRLVRLVDGGLIFGQGLWLGMNTEHLTLQRCERLQTIAENWLLNPANLPVRGDLSKVV